MRSRPYVGSTVVWKYMELSTSGYANISTLYEDHLLLVQHFHGGRTKNSEGNIINPRTALFALPCFPVIRLPFNAPAVSVLTVHEDPPVRAVAHLVELHHQLAARFGLPPLELS